MGSFSNVVHRPCCVLLELGPSDGILSTRSAGQTSLKTNGYDCTYLADPQLAHVYEIIGNDNDVVQGIARLEGEMQAVRALLGNSSTIVAALREIATPSTAARYSAVCQFHHWSMLEHEAGTISTVHF